MLARQELVLKLHIFPPKNRPFDPSPLQHHRDVEFLAELFDRETRDDSAVTCMALEPASNLVFVGYKSGVVRQWECSDWANANTNNWRVKKYVSTQPDIFNPSIWHTLQIINSSID